MKEGKIYGQTVQCAVDHVAVRQWDVAKRHRCDKTHVEDLSSVGKSKFFDNYASCCQKNGISNLRTDVVKHSKESEIILADGYEALVFLGL